MSKDNPTSKIDALCYQIEDNLKVLRATEKAGDSKGSTNIIILIDSLVSQIKAEIVKNY